MDLLEEDLPLAQPHLLGHGFFLRFAGPSQILHHPIHGISQQGQLGVGANVYAGLQISRSHSPSEPLQLANRPRQAVGKKGSIAESVGVF